MPQYKKTGVVETKNNSTGNFIADEDLQYGDLVIEDPLYSFHVKKADPIKDAGKEHGQVVSYKIEAGKRGDINIFERWRIATTGNAGGVVDSVNGQVADASGDVSITDTDIVPTFDGGDAYSLTSPDNTLLNHLSALASDSYWDERQEDFGSSGTRMTLDFRNPTSESIFPQFSDEEGNYPNRIRILPGGVSDVYKTINGKQFKQVKDATEITLRHGKIEVSEVGLRDSPQYNVGPVDSSDQDGWYTVGHRLFSENGRHLHIQAPNLFRTVTDRGCSNNSPTNTDLGWIVDILPSALAPGNYADVGEFYKVWGVYLDELERSGSNAPNIGFFRTEDPDGRSNEKLLISTHIEKTGAATQITRAIINTDETFINGITYTPTSSTMPVGSTALNDHLEQIDTRLSKHNEQGWIQVADSQFDTAFRLGVFADTRTLLPNDGVNVINTYGPAGSASWWDAANDKFQPDQVGDFYTWRTQFVADPALNDRNLTIELDIGTGGSPNVIWSKTIRLARGAGVDTRVTESMDIYTLGTFVTNGGKVYVTCDGYIEIYDIVHLIHRSWRA